MGTSAISEFQKALGQYRIYKRILAQLRPDVKVYLAVSEAIANDFLSGAGMQFLIEAEEVSFFAVNLTREEIVQWTN